MLAVAGIASGNGRHGTTEQAFQRDDNTKFGVNIVVYAMTA